MWKVCIPVLLVTLLIALSSYEAYILKYLSHLICAHELICICDIYIAFEDIFVSGIYLTKICELAVSVDVFGRYVQHVGSICPCVTLQAHRILCNCKLIHLRPRIMIAHNMIAKEIQNIIVCISSLHFNILK